MYLVIAGIALGIYFMYWYVNYHFKSRHEQTLLTEITSNQYTVLKAQKKLHPQLKKYFNDAVEDDKVTLGEYRYIQEVIDSLIQNKAKEKSITYLKE